MNNFDLNAIGVCEMEAAEMREIEGGGRIGKAVEAIGNAIAAIGRILDAIGL